VDKQKLEAILADADFMALPEAEQDAFLSEMSKPRENAMQALGGVMKDAGVKTFQEGPTSFNNLTGGIANAFQSNLKESVFEKMGMDPNIAQNLAIATDPQSILGAQLGNRAAFTKTMKPRMPSSLERLERLKTFSGNRKLVSEVLPSAEIAPELANRKVPKIQTEGLKLIKKTKDPETMVDDFYFGGKDKAQELDSIIGSKSKTYIDPKRMAERAREIYDEVYANSTPEDKVKLDKWFNEELRFISSKDKFDATDAQARKRYLFKDTERFQKKQGQGKQTITEPEKDIVRDAFAQSYREGIENTDPRISGINKELAGRMEGRKASSKTAETFQEQQPVNMEELAAFVAGRPSPISAVAAGVRMLPKFLRRNPIENVTGKIEKAGNKISSLNEKINRLRPPVRMPKPQIEAPQVGLPQPQRMLPPPTEPIVAPGPYKLDIDVMYGGNRALPSPEQVSHKIELPEPRPVPLRSGPFDALDLPEYDVRKQLMDRLRIQSSPLETPESIGAPRLNPPTRPEFNKLPKELMASLKRFKERNR